MTARISTLRFCARRARRTVRSAFPAPGTSRSSGTTTAWRSFWECRIPSCGIAARSTWADTNMRWTRRWRLRISITRLPSTPRAAASSATTRCRSGMAGSGAPAAADWATGRLSWRFHVRRRVWTSWRGSPAVRISSATVRRTCWDGISRRSAAILRCRLDGSSSCAKASRCRKRNHGRVTSRRQNPTRPLPHPSSTVRWIAWSWGLSRPPERRTG